MVQIPIIDLTQWSSGNEKAKQSIAQKIGQACTEIGFFMISGHGIPLATIERANDAARHFFDQPLTTKDQAQAAGGMGYIGPQGENLAASLDDTTLSAQVRPDQVLPELKESLNLTLPVSDEVWPISPEDVRADCEPYYNALIDLSRQLMHLFALALELPETWFDDKIEPPRTILRLLNYPETKLIRAPQAMAQTRAGAHTDYGTLTILWSPDSRGLQAKARNGEWIDIVAPVDHFIINIGDLMMNWTNDQWLSTLHRVVPHAETLGQRRQSMAFFHNPNPEARIECIPTCLAAGEQVEYAPILAKEHLEMKIAKSLGQEVKL